MYTIQKNFIIIGNALNDSFFFFFFSFFVGGGGGGTLELHTKKDKQAVQHNKGYYTNKT